MRLLSSVAVAVGTVAAVASAADIVVNRVVDDFPWGDPFSGHPTPPGFEATCESTRTFKARQHLLSELQEPEPKGLKPWFKALKTFFGGRPFPCSWNGVDAHGTKRDVILMSGSREIEFKIKAQVLRETEQGRIARLEREREDAEVAAAVAANDAEVAAAAAAAEKGKKADAESKPDTAEDAKASADVSDKDEL
ncbi:hypothetical protein MAPG_08139 [Magnaporthiopsis poae ATCC 64411]|uniref:Secreted protein n=1 Tax=Magnaporthiopsis poae (strain ATCC 64411 / 73-15) TaxID=644358 RepID=A0A0C4E6J7_MAGP6|nr:hypothetical protein MAPG_08139 [Magnaporthiopsis poae ATCC 64411]